MRRGLLGAVAVFAAVLLISGCGTGGIASKHTDQGNGQKLFSSNCASCHTLAAANATGTVGPNLDDAFAADKQQGFAESTIQNVVLDQIRLANAPMPQNLVKGQDAQDVAAYVAAVAGEGGVNAKPAAQVGTNGKAIFAADCASCHTLKAAAATGTVGPNLDQLKPSDAIVQHQVTNGGAIMPAFKSKLSPAQIAAVAKFVSSSTH